MKKQSTKLLNLQEVAEKLRVSQRTILRYLRAKKLKGSKLGGGRTALWRIPEEEVEKFLKRYSNE